MCSCVYSSFPTMLCFSFIEPQSPSTGPLPFRGSTFWTPAIRRRFCYFSKGRSKCRRRHSSLTTLVSCGTTVFAQWRPTGLSVTSWFRWWIVKKFRRTLFDFCTTYLNVIILFFPLIFSKIYYIYDYDKSFIDRITEWSLHWNPFKNLTDTELKC